MTVHERRSANLGEWTARRRLLATVAVGAGIAAATGHGVAWADTGQSDSAGTPSSDSSSSTASGPKKPATGRHDRRSAPSTASKHSDSVAPQPDSATAPSGTTRPTRTTKRTKTPHPEDAATTVTAGVTATRSGAASPVETANAVSQTPVAVKTAAPTATVAAVTSATTPNPPGPLSPIAKLVALPGRIINTLLQALDLSVANGGPKSPFNLAPIDEALFAAFRGLESAIGLRRTPAAQPVVASETYTGPTTALTPTVAQLLNAAAAGYVLGGTPGGLVPFTVKGVQMTSTNLLSGESAQVWVTPQKQIVIAYQGTTGGTNLLFNPLMAVSQIIADTQVIFTNTTPQAFTDSLTFEQEVQAAAALQGYDSSDVFLTGHSLGGWEAEYVAQQTGLSGMGFESPGINTVTAGNGVDSSFVNVETYGDTAAYLASDLPALQPFMPTYVPGGGSKPHFGSIVMIGDPNATYPLINASSLFGSNLVGDAIFGLDILGNFFEHHLPGMQAYNLGVSPDPDVVPWLGATMGAVDAGYGDLTISQLELAASEAGTLIKP